MRARIPLLIAAAVASTAGGFTVLQLWRAGTFRWIEPHFAGSCRLVRGPVGPEDITIHPKTAVALVSASDRRAALKGEPVPGAIYAYDLNVPDAQPVNLTPDADVSFQPHGISLWTGENGRDVLFVVNHPPAGTGLPADTVEIFDLDAGRLVHRATLTDPLLVMLNDIVALGADRFYVTRTHKHGPGKLQTLENWLQLKGGQVLFYGPGGFRSVVDGLVFPNGINVSHDGRTVYVAAVTQFAVRVYDRDPASESLSLREVIALGGGPDNIEVAADGTLWIGAHPKLLRIEAHAEDPARLSPSMVLHVRPGAGVDEAYLNAGEQLSASSVAAVQGNRLLIGQIFDDGFLDCTMP